MSASVILETGINPETSRAQTCLILGCRVRDNAARSRVFVRRPIKPVTIAKIKIVYFLAIVRRRHFEVAHA